MAEARERSRKRELRKLSMLRKSADAPSWRQNGRQFAAAGARRGHGGKPEKQKPARGRLEKKRGRDRATLESRLRTPQSDGIG
jgi:hypothetical protein